MRLELSTDEFGSIYGPHNYSVIDPQSHKLSAQVWHWNQEQTEVLHLLSLQLHCLHLCII